MSRLPQERARVVRRNEAVYRKWRPRHAWVIQEQHAERCRLFQQWQGLDFPVVQDLLNTNGIDVVPVYVAIDENGIVRSLPRSPKSFANDFINMTFEPPDHSVPVIESETASTVWWQKRVEQSGSIENLLGWADSLIMWEPNLANVQTAIETYTRAINIAPEARRYSVPPRRCQSTIV